jgi:hypothetical protein
MGDDMKNLKWISIIVVIFYAAWIALPVVSTYVFKTDDPFVPSMAQDSIDYQSRLGMPDEGASADLGNMESIQGETAVEAMESANMPVILLWAGVIVFYLLAAFLQANNSIRAVLAYGFAFLADVILTYLTKGQSGSSISDKILDILSGWDPRYVVTLAAMVMIFLLVQTSLRAQPKS